MARRSIRFPWTGCRTAVALALVALAGQSVKADRTETNMDPAEKIQADNGVARAALAIQLAIEGQQQESPILMLAAAELLGGLKTSERESEAVVAKEPPSEDEASAALPVDVRAWMRLAREYSGDDPALRTLVEGYVESRMSRGLVFRQGFNLPDAEVAGHAFKVLTTDELNPGQSLRLENDIFEGEKPAVVLVIGDGNGDLDLWVYCGNSKGEIGKDTDSTSRCVVQWMTKYEGPFSILIRNVGRGREKFAVLANW